MTNKIMLDYSPSGVQRRASELDRRMNSERSTGAERAAARKRIEGEIEAEELARAETAAAHAEATSERQRIAAIVSAGSDLGRPRQALKLGLAGPISTDQARTILANLPLDDDAPAAAMSLPELGSFGGKTAQAERKRIGSVFAHPAAEGRFKSASALALESSEALPASAIISMLQGLPVDQLAPKYPSLEERDAEFASFGPDDSGSSVMSKGQKIDAAWSRAVSDANAMIGATDAPKTPIGANGHVYDPESDADFGLVSQLPGGQQ